MKKYIFLLFLSHVCLIAYAQIQVSAYMPQVRTAESTAVERFSTYPMDYSTGLPNITIPLYEIKVGDITLPITLSYHSSGMKPNEDGGRIAKGWTLNAEPSISKQVRGNDDALRHNGKYGFFYTNDTDYMGERENLFFKHASEGKIDTYPDIFFYKLADKSGSFFSNGTNEYGRYWIPQPQNGVNITGDPYNITIKDDNGLTYNFGGFGFMDTYTGADMYGVPVLLKCSKIQSAITNASVTFSYNESGIINHDYRSYTHTDFSGIFYDRGDNPNYSTPVLLTRIAGRVRHYIITRDGGLSNGDSYTMSGGGVTILPHTASGTVDQSNGLREIKFNNGSIVFEGDNRSGIDIYVKDIKKNTIKEINLFCSKYGGYYSDRDMMHTKLDSIKISTPGGDVQKYTFEYSGDAPAKDTRSIDYWGFYNRNDRSGYADMSMVPSFDVVLDVFGKKATYRHIGLSREPDLSATKAGVLTKITNPNGVVTTYDYELNLTGLLTNHYSSGCTVDLPEEKQKTGEDNFWLLKADRYFEPKIAANIAMGGLRIREIEEKNPTNGRVTTRRFQYSTEGSQLNGYYIKSWGVPKRLPTSKMYDSMTPVSDPGHSAYLGYSCNTSVDLGFNGGSSVLYGRVEETVSFNDSKERFTTEYDYTTPNFQPWNWNNPPMGKVFVDGDKIWYEKKDTYRYYGLRASPKGFDDINYGKLKKKKEYNVPDGNEALKKIVRKQEYENELIRSSDRLVDKYITKIVSYDGSHGAISETDIANNYESYSIFGEIENEDYGFAAISRLKKEKSTEYLPSGDSIVTEKAYTYSVNESFRIDKTTSSSSNGKKKEEFFVYSGFPELKHHSESLSVQDAPIGILVEHKSVVDKDTVYTRQKLYKGEWNKINVGLIKTKSAQGPLFDDVLNIKHDRDGNIVETVGADGISTAYIWSYNNQYLVAKIENASHEQVKSMLEKKIQFYTFTMSGILDSLEIAFLNSLRDSLPESMVYTYTYKPLVGMLTSTDPSGKTMYYEYDSSNRLKRTYFIEKDASGKDVERSIEAYEYNFPYTKYKK